MIRWPARAPAAAILLAVAVPLVPSVAYMTAGDPVKQEAGGGVRPDAVATRDYLGGLAGNLRRQASDGICSGVVQILVAPPSPRGRGAAGDSCSGQLLVSVLSGEDYVIVASWQWRRFTVRAGAAGLPRVAARAGRGQTARPPRSCPDPG